MTDVRTGQAPAMLTREEFGKRFRLSFFDPLFDAASEAIAQIEAIAWRAYSEGRKSPLTRKAGAGFADPDFELSTEWLETRQRLARAQDAWSRPDSPTRVLLICGAARNDGTCPGEISKTFRLLTLIRDEFTAAGMQTDVLDLSLLASEYGRRIHPCKACVSTAMAG